MKKLMLTLTLIFSLTTLFADIKIYTKSSHPIIVKGKKQKVYLQVNLEGIENENKSLQRTPVNLAVVMDKSGSMSGAKIQSAKNAAKLIVNTLSKDDIFSLVLYDTQINTLIPATKVTNKKEILEKIEQISADGGTALFNGLGSGLMETEKFLASKYVNRIVLLSDGLANHGPTSTDEICELALAAIKQGISITTIGIGNGYNEELMSALALKSDGNHGFAEKPEQIASLLESELGNILNISAKNIQIKLTCQNGVIPLKVLDKEAFIEKNEVLIHLNQVYVNQINDVIIELEVNQDALENESICLTEIQYINNFDQKTKTVKISSNVKYSTDEKLVEKSKNNEILASVITYEALKRNREAIQLAKEGNIERANEILTLNCQSVIQQNIQLDSSTLKELLRNTQELQKQVEKNDYKSESKKYYEYDQNTRSKNKLKK